MSQFHLSNLSPLTDDDAVVGLMPSKMKEAMEDPAYDNPCRGIMIAVLASSVFWILVYILVQYFRGMG
jgi:hypothetical protein